MPTKPQPFGCIILIMSKIIQIYYTLNNRGLKFWLNPARMSKSGPKKYNPGPTVMASQRSSNQLFGMIWIISMPKIFDRKDK